MSEVINKKITMDVTTVQHRRVRDASKLMNVTQQELLGIIIDLTLTNIEGIRYDKDTDTIILSDIPDDLKKELIDESEESDE